MSHTDSKAPSVEWQEHLTGPGVSFNHGYGFERLLRRLFSTKTIPSEGAALKTGTPPESSVLLAAKHRYGKAEGKDWDDATVETQQHYLDSTRVMISSGPLLTKAKYLAKFGATSWNDYHPKE